LKISLISASSPAADTTALSGTGDAMNEEAQVSRKAAWVTGIVTVLIVLMLVVSFFYQ
jgi:hypothetical protein